MAEAEIEHFPELEFQIETNDGRTNKYWSAFYLNDINTFKVMTKKETWSNNPKRVGSSITQAISLCTFWFCSILLLIIALIEYEIFFRKKQTLKSSAEEAAVEQHAYYFIDIDIHTQL